MTIKIKIFTTKHTKNAQSTQRLFTAEARRNNLHVESGYARTKSRFIGTICPNGTIPEYVGANLRACLPLAWFARFIATPCAAGGGKVTKTQIKIKSLHRKGTEEYSYLLPF